MTETKRFIVDVSVSDDVTLSPEQMADQLLDALTAMDDDDIPWAFSFDAVDPVDEL